MASLALASLTEAATLYVSPTGTDSTDCTRATPCSITYAGNNAKAGDTVVLLDGVYKNTPLDVKNSGTSSAWIVFQADECATPIIEGPGDDEQTTGVGAAGKEKATYLRFIGLVSRGWNSAFGNHWVKTEDGELPPSNGNLEYKFCIGEGNGRTGFAHYSASGIHIENCISAHNGGSVAHSWSSGVALFATSEGSGNALVEGTVSFENTDAQKHTDGSGFIVDESSNNATFLNNIAFGNGGSCFRLTTSSGTKFINNTCYRNARDPLATGPTNPGEIYFTNDVTRSGVTVKNNVFIATGTGAGAEAVLGQPSSGWSNNVVHQSGGTVTLFTSPEGTNPDFSLATSATTLIGKGSAGGGAPTNDIGFDSKCIVKNAPTMLGSIPKESWWQYSVDIDYIKSIGGVAKCFNTKTRSSTPDIGAYVNGAVTRSTVPCTRSTGGATSTGGAVGIGGTDAGGTDAGGTNAGGSNAGGTNAGGTNAGGTGANTKGGATGTGASTSTGGTVTANGGTSATSSNAVVGGGPTNNGGGTTVGPVGEPQASGCGCRVAAGPSHSLAVLGLGMLGACLFRLQTGRRRTGRLLLGRPRRSL